MILTPFLQDYLLDLQFLQLCWVFIIIASRYNEGSEIAGLMYVNNNSEKKREATDVICLVLFIFFTLIMLIAGIYSYNQVSTSKYDTPYDSDGKGCGIDYPGYSYIYFPSPQVDVKNNKCSRCGWPHASNNVPQKAIKLLFAKQTLL